MNVAAFCFFDNNICSAQGTTCKISQSSRLAIAGIIFYFISMCLACKVPAFREIEEEVEELDADQRGVVKPVVTGVTDVHELDQGTVQTDAPPSPTHRTQSP